MFSAGFHLIFKENARLFHTFGSETFFSGTKIKTTLLVKLNTYKNQLNIVINCTAKKI